MVHRRGFGEVERRRTGTGSVGYRARYIMPNGNRYSRTFGAKVDAEAWLASERSLVERGEWTPPQAREAAAARKQAQAAVNTVALYAERYLRDPDRGLPITT